MRTILGEKKKNSGYGEKKMFVDEIEVKRKLLIKTAKKYGINANETIQCSQELDLLLLKEIIGTNKHVVMEDESSKEYA